MAWLPTDNDAMTNEAVPSASVTVLLPGMAVPLSLKVTVPVGVPAPGEAGLTVAVKVAGSP